MMVSQNDEGEIIADTKYNVMMGDYKWLNMEGLIFEAFGYGIRR